MFQTPPVVKNLLIINVLFFMAQTLLPSGEEITNLLGLHSATSSNFKLYQLFSYMFLHANTMHLFTNMFGLWMFGRIAEYDLGSKRFLTYYLVAGVGAGLINLGVNGLESMGLNRAIEVYAQTPNPDDFKALIVNYFNNYNPSVLNDFVDAWSASPLTTQYAAESFKLIDMLKDGSSLTIGASGAVFAILLAFGMMHPNDRIMLLIPPIPMKAKYFVIGYAVLELILGVTRHGATNIAHFAHVGGMLWGWMMLYYWKKRGKIR